MNTPDWLQTLFFDPAVTDICINGAGAGRVFYDRGQGLESVLIPEPVWSESELKLWVLHQLSLSGRSWDARHPFVDAMVGPCHRMQATFPPVCRSGLVVTLRRLPQLTARAWGTEPRESPEDRHRRAHATLAAHWGASPQPILSTLVSAISHSEALLISGATGSGKTTLMNDLLSLVPANERMIALEDTPELNPEHEHFVSMLSRPPNADGQGEISVRTLLKQALRMRPDRLVVGECRGAEALELLQALNTGHPGSMATLHANSPRDALRRLELLCSLSTEGAIATRTLREWIVSGIRWVAQVKRTLSPNGTVRSVTELAQVVGLEGDTILLRPVVDFGATTHGTSSSGGNAQTTASL